MYKHPIKRYNLLTILYVADTLDNCGKRSTISISKVLRSHFFFQKISEITKITKKIKSEMKNKCIDYLSFSGLYWFKFRVTSYNLHWECGWNVANAINCKAKL